MNDGNMPSAEEFSTAFQTEMGVEPPAAPVATPPAPTPSSDEGGTDAPTPPPASTEEEKPVPPTDEKTPPEGEPTTPQGGDTTDEKVETPEEKANREAEEAAKPLTADDIKAAIREANQETTSRVDQVHTVREEIIGKLHPEGIDRNIYDDQGNVIKTAQDIVDRGLINDRTGEPFTYEQAASFLLDANRQMDENLNQLKDWAENIAEKNVSLFEGNQRVMDQWGSVLKNMPDLAKDMATEYIETQLEFDKTNSYIVRMGMTPEQYYNRVMTPYKALNEAYAAQEARQEQETQQRQTQDQEERAGLPPQRGQSDVKANTGDPMLDALIDELNKG